MKNFFTLFFLISLLVPVYSAAEMDEDEEEFKLHITEI